MKLEGESLEFRLSDESQLVGRHAQEQSLQFRRQLQDLGKERKGNALFNDTLNTFYLRLYGVGHMVKDHSDSDRGNLLLPHGLLFSD